MSLTEGIVDVIWQQALTVLPTWKWAVVAGSGLIGLWVLRSRVKTATWGSVLSMVFSFFVLRVI